MNHCLLYVLPCTCLFPCQDGACQQSPELEAMGSSQQVGWQSERPTFAKHFSHWNAIFPIKMPPVLEVWSWSLPGKVVNPASPLALPHTNLTQSSCLVGILGWKHDQNRPNGHKLPKKQSLPDFLTLLMELDPTTILSCNVHIVRMIFAL